MSDEDLRRFLAQWVVTFGEDEVHSDSISPFSTPDLPFEYKPGDFVACAVCGFIRDTRGMNSRSCAYKITEAGLNFIKGEANHVGNIEQLSNDL